MAIDPSEIAGDAEWARLGRALRRVDVARYLEIVRLVEEIVLTHEQPNHARCVEMRERYLTIPQRKSRVR